MEDEELGLVAVRKGSAGENDRGVGGQKKRAVPLVCVKNRLLAVTILVVLHRVGRKTHGSGSRIEDGHRKLPIDTGTGGVEHRAR